MKIYQIKFKRSFKLLTLFFLAFFVSLFSPGSSALAANPVFYSKADYPAGTKPNFVLTKDFNADGKNDLAVTNETANNISIFFGVGDGTFSPKTDYPTGSLPTSVAAGDFNADGKIDLAITNYGGNSISILLGVGDGTFGAKTDYPAGSMPTSVATGDFNADGKTDLAVSVLVGNNVSIFLGVGDGTFGAKVNYAVGSNSRMVKVGDFNADGREDLVLAVGTSNVAVLLGNGLGGFGSASNFTVASTPYSVTTGDFNADGKTDLATAHFGTGNISVLLGVGDGTFDPKVNYSAGSYPLSIINDDFNVDGKIDLAIVNNYANTVSIFSGIGDGTFNAQTIFLIGTRLLAVTSGDFNADNKADLVTANEIGNSVSVLINNQPGATKKITAFSIFGQVDPATIDETLHTINLSMPLGTNLASLTPEIMIDGASISPASSISQDFSSPVTYTVTAADSSVQNYSVSVVALGEEAAPYSVINQIFALPSTADLVLSNKPAVISCRNAYDALTIGQKVLVTNYSILIAAEAKILELESSKSITAFSVVGEIGEAVINESTHSITFMMSVGADVTALIPSFTATGASVKVGTTAQTSALTPNDFTSPVTYTVTAEDGSTTNYTVTVTLASNIATITSNTYTISNNGTNSEAITNIPYNTSKTTFLAALIKGQANQTWNDTGLTNPVVTGNTLVVKAQDATTTVTYTLTVKAQENTGGGGGGGGSYLPTPCATVTYSEWSICTNNLQSRDILNQSPSSCSLTAFQQQEKIRACLITPQTLFDPSFGSTTTTTPTSTKQVLGEKKYANHTLLRGSSKTIYVVLNNKLKRIMNLKELHLYPAPILQVTDEVISSFQKVEVLGIKKYLFTKDLSLGITHLEVKELQKYLNTHGFLVSLKGNGSLGRETTTFGKATKSALIRFQKANKIIPANGEFKIKTRTLINSKP